MSWKTENQQFAHNLCLKSSCTAVYKIVALVRLLVGSIKMKQIFFSDFTYNELTKAAHFSNISFLKHITSAI